MGATRRRRQVLSFILLAVAIGACWLAVRNNLGDVSDTFTRIEALDVIVVLALGVVAAFTAYRSWRVVLFGLHADMPAHEARSMFFCSQVGKYLPGSVWPALIQSEIGARNRVPRPTVLLAYLIALLASLSSAAMLSVLLLGDARSTWLALASVGAALGGACLVGVLLSPKGAQRFLDWVGKRRSIGAGMTLTPHHGRRAIAWATAAWCSMCLEGVWLAWRLAPHQPSAAVLMAVAGATTLSWACGFLAVPVPAGTGVREAIFTFALAASLGRPTAITVAVVTRLVGVFTDLGAALLSGLPSLLRSTAQRRRTSLGDAAGDLA